MSQLFARGRTVATARALHDKLLDRAPRVKYLISGSPLDDRYAINMELSGKVRHGRIIIDFDQTTHPDESLTEPANIKDLITAKLYVLLNIAPGIGDVTSSQALSQRFRALLTLIRWRNALDIRRMGALTPTLFSRFQTDMRFGDGGLLPLADRALSYVEQRSERREPLPTYGSKSKINVAWRAISRHLGLSSGHGLTSRARVILLDYLREYDPILHGRELARLRLDELDESDEPITSARALMMLTPWQCLWGFREYLTHDALTFNPFSDDRDRQSVASAIGREVEKTKDIPPEQACHLIEQAMLWVLNFGDSIVGLLERAVPVIQNPSGSNNVRWKRRRDRLAELIAATNLPIQVAPVFQAHTKVGSNSQISVRTLVYDLLVAACFILIATFTGRRRGELESLDRDCVVHDADGVWMLSWIEKTLRDIDRTPIPACVSISINLLRRIDAVTETARKDSWLLRLVMPTTPPMVSGFKPNPAINLFALVVGVPLLPTGERWWFSCHQFRRFFAVAYFWHLRFPSLLALSAHFRHYDGTITERYVKGLIHGTYEDFLIDGRAPERVLRAAKKARVESRSRKREFEEYLREFVATRLRWALAEKEWIGGLGGAKLMQELRQRISDALGPISIVPESLAKSTKLNQVIDSFASEVVLTPDRRGCSFCKFGSSTADPMLARCLMKKASIEGPQAIAEATGPDKAYAEDLDCAKCALGVQFEETQRYWKNARRAEDKLSRKGTTAGLRKAAKDRLHAITRLLKEWSIL